MNFFSKNPPKSPKKQFARKGVTYCHWCQTELLDWHVICPHCNMHITNHPKNKKK